MSAVAILPTRTAVEAAWERYRALALRWKDDDVARVDLEFNMDLARAHRAWVEAFLAWDQRC